MPDSVCATCGRAFAHHFVVRARSAARWRGPSFDAAQAKANAGLAVADALGIRPTTPEGAERFARVAFVEAFRESGRDTNPAEPFDPREAGEWWEFHVGLSAEASEESARAAESAAVAAVARTRNFSHANAAP